MLEKLRVPFPASVIKERRGGGGRSLSYVGGEEYIRRLLDTVDLDWSFEVVDYQVGDEDVMVRGRLRIGTQVVEQFGGQARAGQETLGDALKGAATDALKKCASLRGLGLHLWLDEEPAPGSAPPQTSGQRSSGAAPGRQASTPSSGQRQGGGGQTRPQGNGGGQGGGGGPATERQLNAVGALSRKFFPDQATAEAYCLEHFGAVPAKLTKTAASDFIKYLSEQLNG